VAKTRNAPVGAHTSFVRFSPQGEEGGVGFAVQGLLERRENGVGIYGSLHRFCDPIDSVADTWHIAPKLLYDLDELRDLLLRKRIGLQLGLRALLRVTVYD
jgi:hypothetical protein